MPKLDGVEAARRVYAERPLPIIMLTAYSDRKTVERAVDAGVFSYLSKPFGPQDIIPAIGAAVARHADLLTARREVGKREEPIEVEVTSSSGRVWPLRVHRKPDGSIAVDVLPEEPLARFEVVPRRRQRSASVLSLRRAAGRT